MGAETTVVSWVGVKAKLRARLWHLLFPYCLFCLFFEFLLLRDHLSAHMSGLSSCGAVEATVLCLIHKLLMYRRRWTFSVPNRKADPKPNPYVPLQIDLFGLG